MSYKENQGKSRFRQVLGHKTSSIYWSCWYI